jgi:dolichol-phosphate mannosyltransferase
MIKGLRVLAVLPTYNEADNIGPIVAALLALDTGLDVMVVDDASPDGTAERARDAARGRAPAVPDQSARVRVVVRAEKLGLGSAHRLGMAAGIEGRYDLVLTMDADGSHDPAHVPALIAAMAGHDLAIGSRYVPGAAIVNWGLHRHVISRTANTLARLVLGRDVHDWTSAYRCYRAPLLARLPLTRFRSDGYAFCEEILFECRRLGCATVEVPIIFVERRAGRSKIATIEILAAAWRLLVLGLKRLKAGKNAVHVRD